MTKQGPQWAAPRLSAALQRLPPSHPAELSDPLPQGKEATLLVYLPPGS